MKKKLLSLVISCFFAISCTSQDSNDEKVQYLHEIKETDQKPLNIQRISDDDGKVRAFTDIIFFNNQFFLTFRESDNHVYGLDGKIKVYNSPDGSHWNLLKEFSVEGMDLRDPKFSLNGNELLLYIHGSKYQGKTLVEFRDYCSRYATSIGWQNLENVALDNLKSSSSKLIGNESWPWRVTWYNKIAYTVGYSLNGIFDVYTSDDGLFFKGTNIRMPNLINPSEATIRVDENGVFYVVIRSTDIVLAKSTDQSKSWKALGRIPISSFGGPNFIFYNQKILLTGRDSSRMKVVLYSCDVEANTYKKIYTFPSGGNDCGYPGMVVKDDELWISYYSSDENKMGSSIYVTKIKLEDLSL